MSQRRSRLSATCVLAVAAVLLLTGCGGEAEAGTKTAPGAATSSGTGKATGASNSPATAESKAPRPEPRYAMPRVGQCFQMSSRQSRAPVSTARKKGCTAPHTTVVAYAGVQPGAVTAQTPLARRRAIAARVCRSAFTRIVGGTPADRATSLLTWTFFTPSAVDLERGARWVRCDVLARSGDALVPLPAGTPLLRFGVPEGLRVCQTPNGTDVSCARPHAFRVEAVYRADGPAYPRLRAYTPTARDRCKELMGGFGGYWQPASRIGWKRGDHFIRCLRRTG